MIALVVMVVQVQLICLQIVQKKHLYLMKMGGEVGMTEREDTIERIERALSLTHKKSVTVILPRFTAERAVSLLKEQEGQIEQLEHDLAVTQNNLNYYVNGNN